MPKFWVKQIFSYKSFPVVGQKQKTEKKEERPKVGNNNGQLCIANTTSCGARKAALAKIKWCQNIGKIISIKLHRF